MQTNTAISEFRSAGFWRRALAFLIDLAITGAGLYLLEFAVTQAWWATFDWSGEAESGLVWMGAAIFLGVSWLYSAGFESSERGATPGKMLLGLRVQRPDGSRVGFWRATGRYLGKLLSAVILGIGFLMAAWSKRKQALHDLLADTVVGR